MRIATFDIEANGFLEQVEVVHCAVVKDQEGIKTLFTPENIHELCSFLTTFDIIRGHNIIGYDLPVLRKIFHWEYPGVIQDTLLMSRTQRPDRAYPNGCPRNAGPHSVEAYGYRFGLPKKEHEDWTVFSQEMLERCSTDVDIQARIYDFLIEEGKDENWNNAHKLNAKLFYWLQRQEEYGWLVDKELIVENMSLLDRWVGKIDKTVGPRLPLICEAEETKVKGEYGFVKKPFLKSGHLTERVQEWLYNNSIKDNVVGQFSRVGFRPVDLDSNLEVKNFLLAAGWEPTEWNTNQEGKRSSPKFSKDDEFVGISSGLGRLIAKRIQCKQRKGILQGWLDSIRPDGRITPSVGGIATTGRLKHRGIVNVPSIDAKAFFAKQMRSVFIAKPGWVLVGTDSASNQMRQLAGRLYSVSDCGDREFEYAILSGKKEEGTDLHSLNQKRSGVDTRTKAKNFFYGCILFGAGLPKTAKIIGSTNAKAKELKDQFFAEMPLLAKFIEIEKEKWRKTATKVYNSRYNKMEYKDGYIRGLDGRPIKVEFEKDILVYYLQSDEAIHMSTAYVWLHKDLEKAGYRYIEDWGAVIFYHDEFCVECRPEIAEDVGRICRNTIEKAGKYLGIQCAHAGDTKIGASWAGIH